MSSGGQTIFLLREEQSSKTNKSRADPWRLTRHDTTRTSTMYFVSLMILTQQKWKEYRMLMVILRLICLVFDPTMERFFAWVSSWLSFRREKWRGDVPNGRERSSVIYWGASLSPWEVFPIGANSSVVVARCTKKNFMPRWRVKRDYENWQFFTSKFC